MTTFAFIAPITLAVEFNVWVGTTEDKSTDPGLQLLYPSTDNILKVIVYFDQAVELQTSHIEISGYDATNTYDPAIVLVPAEQYPIYPEGAQTAFWVRIAVTEGTSRVTLKIAGGIPSHNPISSDTSKELTEEIGVLAGGVAGTEGGEARDDIRVDPTTPVATTTVDSGGGTDVIGAPRVYSIRRADNSTLPLASGAVNIIVTLSEQPQSFTATHINVTNATAGTPVLSNTTTDRINLLAITTYLISTGAISPQPPLRTVDELRTVIKNYMNDDPPDAPVPAAFIETVRALRTAVNTIANPWRYYYITAAGTQTYQTLWNGAGTPFELFPLVNNAVPPPGPHGTANLTGTSGGVTVPILAADFDRSAEEPTAPKVSDYIGQPPGNYHFARAVYNALSSPSADNQRAAYKAEKTAYDTYIALQNALQAHDVAQQRAWDQEVANAATMQGAEHRETLPPTGRDGLLYQYTVTITPTYANNNSVVVKVNTWQNTDVPSLSYAPPILETDYTEGFDKLTIEITGGQAEDVARKKDEARKQGGFHLVFGAAPDLSDGLQREQIQAQIDLLLTMGDRSPEALKTLAYLQQLLATARPEKTQLLANYPNPFNPETWIPYELATDTNVKITIYNTQGGVVRTLQLGQQSAGYYTGRDRAAYWDGRNAHGEQVSSGVYFYQFETDEMSALRKMVILK